MKRLLGVMLVLAAVVLTSTDLSAQTPVVINPTIIEWDPSPDHGVTLSDGTAILTKYEVRIYMRGATAPFQVHDAGKPAPGTGGKISVTNPGWLTLSAMNTEGFARVAAIGPAGEGVSDPSNPFARVSAPGAVPAPVVRRQ
jgi:hypothetical protein